jgi:hypothetical protein
MRSQSPRYRAGQACLVALAAALAGTACGNSSNVAGSQSPPVSETSVCASDPRAELYSAGMQQASSDGAVTIRFADADPAPPSKGDNTWTIRLGDAAGQPIEGATITTSPFMPDHGHGASVMPTTTPMSNGLYQIAPLTFFMPGIWQTTFAVQTPKGDSETVVFTFCVDG